MAETLRYEKKSLLKKRPGPVAKKINRRNILKRAIGVLVIEVHLVACLFVCSIIYYRIVRSVQ